MPDPTGMMSASTEGAELLLGNGLVISEVSAAPTETTFPHMAVRARVSGATIILSMFDKTSGAWREVTLS